MGCPGGRGCEFTGWQFLNSNSNIRKRWRRFKRPFAQRPPPSDGRVTKSLSRNQAFALITPFAGLWLYLGLVVNPAVFQFWRTCQTIGNVAAMELCFVPVLFTLIYLPMVFAWRGTTGKMDWVTVGVSAVIAFVIAEVCRPLP